jgi:hypothetical protein
MRRMMQQMLHNKEINRHCHMLGSMLLCASFLHLLRDPRLDRTARAMRDISEHDSCSSGIERVGGCACASTASENRTRNVALEQRRTEQRRVSDYKRREHFANRRAKQSLANEWRTVKNAKREKQRISSECASLEHSLNSADVCLCISNVWLRCVVDALQFCVDLLENFLQTQQSSVIALRWLCRSCPTPTALQERCMAAKLTCTRTC